MLYCAGKRLAPVDLAFSKAMCHLKAGELAPAKEILDQALEGYKDVLGPDHEQTQHVSEARKEVTYKLNDVDSIL